VGHLRKSEVRHLAEQRGLATAAKRESQEICFVPDGDYAGFVERRSPGANPSGPIVDREGRHLGRHPGVHHYTVGQRRGLGLGGPRPRYVLSLRSETRTVVVGSEEDLQSGALIARDVNWLSTAPPSGPREAQVKIRYRHTEANAGLVPLPDGRVRVEFEVPQRAVAPGQAAVFYDGDVCLGGGWIE
jgi:tRNA-specific 2-thiouridylase